MSERRLILRFPVGTVFSGNGDTATNMTTVTPAPGFTVDQLFSLPGVIGWAAQSGLQFECTIASLAGTNPTVQFLVDVLGGDGAWYPIYAGPAVNAAGAFSVSIGPGLQVPQAIGTQGRLRWVVGGTSNPSATGSAALSGV